MKLDCVRCNKCGKIHSVEKGCDLPEAGASAERSAQPHLCEGWRDVRQELPPIEHQAYFVYDKEGSMGFAHYLGEGIFGGWPDVIAWMLLPSPPAFV